MALLAGLDPGLLDGVDLQEAVELGLVAPGAVVVVVVDLPGRRVDDDGIGPVGQPDDEPGGLAAEELCRAEDRRGSCEAAAGGADGRVVADLGLDVTMWDKTMLLSFEWLRGYHCCMTDF